jgi:hypothetical protein
MPRHAVDEPPAPKRRGLLPSSLRRRRPLPGEAEVPVRRKRMVDRLPGWTRKPGPLALGIVVTMMAGCGVYAMVDLLANGNAAVSTTPTGAPPPPFVPPVAQTDAPVGVGDPAEGPGLGSQSATAGPSGTPSNPRGPAGSPATTGPAAPGSATCTATYRVASDWPGGIQTEITVTNTGQAAITGWTTSWTFENGETITQLWNGQDTASGAQHTVRNVDYNGGIGPGASTTFGFTANVDSQDAGTPTVACAAQP